jgi:phosphatidylglycerophosphate synthase
MREAERIQTSLLYAVERKALIWLAKRQPSWVTSDMLTFVGTVGALMFAIGFILSRDNISWLWFSSLGMIVNWYGDSLDGTLARVRKTQRPIYGYYLDHTVDCINEGLMFFGIGLSGWMRLELALTAFVLYLFLTINVSMNAHLKGEFKLSYGNLGPTEFRILVILADTVLFFVPAIRQFSKSICIGNQSICLSSLDLLAVLVIAALVVIYLATIISDAKHYSSIDPKR